MWSRDGSESSHAASRPPPTRDPAGGDPGGAAGTHGDPLGQERTQREGTIGRGRASNRAQDRAIASAPDHGSHEMPHIDLPDGLPGILGPMAYRPDGAVLV